MIQAGIIQVSKHAMDLINAGKAYYGSGGVRLLDGRFVELYRIGRNLLQHGPNTLPINPIIPSPDPVTMTVQIANQVVGTAASLVNVYVDSNKVQSGLKRTIWLENPTETTENLEGTFDFTLNTIHLQYQELQETKEVIPQLSREAYFDFDTFVKQKIDSGDVEVIDQALEEDSRESVLFRKNGFVMA